MRIFYNSLIAVLVSIVVLVGCHNNDDTDYKEISHIVSSSEVIYQSKRGFGNDRFDIYQFSIKKSNAILHEFQMIEPEDIDKFVYLLKLEEEDANNPNFKEIEQKILRLIQSQNVQYKYIKLDGTDKLYIYSEKDNIVYGLIHTI